jgi:hypothetical protein
MLAVVAVVFGVAQDEVPVALVVAVTVHTTEIVMLQHQVLLILVVVVVVMVVKVTILLGQLKPLAVLVLLLLGTQFKEIIWHIMQK